MTTGIIGTGSYLPEKVLTNDDLSRMVDTSDEWISTRTGIKSRHISDEETTEYMAYMAGMRALESAGVSAEDMDMIITATFTPHGMMPSIACRVQKMLGNTSATCYDVNAACSGFVYALAAAHAYIMSGMCEKILVIGAENISKFVDWSDRGTCVLFGDGAGAVVVSREDAGIQGIVTGSDGTKCEVLTCEEAIAMNGQEVFKFAVKKVPECIEKLLNQTGHTTEDIDMYILHQANERIIASVAKRLGVGQEKFPMNLQNCGNTSAASIPILLDELNRQGKIAKNNKVILAGFGGGLTWGAIMLNWL